MSELTVSMPLTMSATLRVLHARLMEEMEDLSRLTDPKTDVEQFSRVELPPENLTEEDAARTTAIILAAKELWAYALGALHSNCIDNKQWAKIEMCCQKALSRATRANPDFTASLSAYRSTNGVRLTF